MWDCTQTHIIAYKIVTCVMCYHEIFRFKEDLYYDNSKFHLVPKNNSLFYKSTDKFMPYIGNEKSISDVCKSLSNQKCEKWKTCCMAAINCCERHQNMNISSSNIAGARCPRGWDGVGCFMDTDNGTVATTKCPSYLQDSDTNAYAIKPCHSNGSWFRHPNTGKIWTNYTPCVNIEEQYPLIYSADISYAVSLVFLTTACGIFLLIKQLRCQQRIKMHFHFFVSLIFLSVMIIVFNKELFEEHTLQVKGSKISKNSATCKIIMAVLQYTTSATYFWMLCEALFLHRCVTIKAFKPPKHLGLYYFIGWGLPCLQISIWIAIREFVKEYNYQCWIHPVAGVRWILRAPQIICILINLALLIHIFYFLTYGLQVQPNEPSKIRKVLKASFMLIPLFGIPCILAIYRPKSPSIAYYTELVNRIVQGSQGTLVSILFCFFNAEVHTLLKQRFAKSCPDCLKRPKQRKFSISSAGTTAYHVSQPTTPVKTYPKGSEEIPTELFPFARPKVRFSLQDESKENSLPETIPLT